MHTLRRIAVVIALIFMTRGQAFAANCSWITTPAAIAFGNYSVFSTANYASSSRFTIRCTPNTTGIVKLSRGGSGSYAPRRMSSGANTAAYNLYLNAGGTSVWGDASGGSTSYDVYNGTPRDKDFTDFIYGVLPAAQDIPAGTYTDTIFATLSYSTPGGVTSTLPNVSFTVSATVIAECRVDSVNLNFGTYNPFNTTAVTQSGTVKVYCTKNSAPLSVTLNSGSYPSGAQKRMSNAAGAFLNYAATLGSTTGTSTSSLVPIGGGFTVAGTLPPQQDVPTGAYADVITTTVNY